MPPSVINLAMVLGLWITLVVGCCNFGNRQSGNNSPTSTPGSSSSSTDTANSSDISAVDLYDEWKRDKDAAEAKYKNKTLVVTGRIRLVNDRSIVLNSGEKSDMLGVQCIFKDSERSRAAELSAGQNLTVEGLCVGRIGNIVLNNCSIR